jgi:hypothetical protein
VAEDRARDTSDRPSVGRRVVCLRHPSAYIGSGSEFDKAIAEFAMAYADQTEHDWRALLDAIEAGRISAEEPPST